MEAQYINEITVPPLPQHPSYKPIYNSMCTLSRAKFTYQQYSKGMIVPLIGEGRLLDNLQ
jgi:hypothetical protein